MRVEPPKLPFRLLRWFCDPKLLKYIEGDLIEIYQERVQDRGVRMARWLFSWEVLRLFRPGIIKSFGGTQRLNHYGMFKNYFKITLRSLVRQKLFNSINIFGLAVGLASCILISIYVGDELSYDQYHKNADRTYRLTREFKSPDGSTSLHLSRLAPPFVPLLREDFPEMETVTRFISFGSAIRYEDKVFYEDQVTVGDNELFRVFDFNFIHGDPVTALSQPGSVVVSEEVARRYFGTTDALGKLIQFNNQVSLKVTGVIENMPENSHFKLSLVGDFSLVESYYGGREQLMQAWGSNNFSTYFTLKPGASIVEIERRLPDFLKKNLGDNAIDWNELHIQKMTDIHLHSHLDDELGANSDIRYVYVFVGIALLVLVIAMINYMNLATAKSSNRAKEVGVRKVLGAGRANLSLQFLFESVFTVFLAVILACGLVLGLLPSMRVFTDRALDFGHSELLMGLGVVLLAGLLVGIISGIYPSFYMVGLKPLRSLKSSGSGGGQIKGFRKGLVVFQFAISAMLIVATWVVYQQLNFIRNKELGYDKDQILTLPMYDSMRPKFKVFKEALLAEPDISSIGTSSRVPTIQLLDSDGAKAELNGEMVSPDLVIKNLRADHDFLSTYSIPLVSGRGFDPGRESDDTQAFILNETAVRMIGWDHPDEAIGKKVNYGQREGKVIGVIRDIHFETLQNRIAPLIVYVPEGRLGRQISLKMAGANVSETLLRIEEKWKGFFPGEPFRYRFIDERFDQLYRAEEQRAKLYTMFSFIAIFLACLGLFGLSSYTVVQRSKEICIRKVLGASVLQIVTILSREFMVLVGISALIAFPFAYYFMEEWLRGYAYRIDMSLVPFLCAAALSVAIAFMTIGLQTFKAASANPAESLRDE